MDGLAGLVDHQRPYASGWLNFKIKDFEYPKNTGTYNSGLDLCAWDPIKINKILS